MPLSCVLFTIGIISMQIYPSVGLLLPSLKQPLVFICVLFAGLAQFIYFTFENGKKNFNKNTMIYYFGMLFSIICMVFISLYNSGIGKSNYHSYTTIVDIVSMAMYTSGIIFTAKNSRMYTYKILLVLGAIGVVNGTLAIFSGDFTAFDRSNTWTNSYILWFSLFPWLALLVFSLFKLKQLSLLEKVITYFSTLLYLVLGMLFLKRIVLFELLLIVFVTGFAQGYGRFFKRGFIILIFSTIFLYIGDSLLDLNIMKYFELTINRFNEFDTVGGFNRVEEFTVGLSGFGLLDYLFGVGFGGLHFGFGDPRGNMHIAWANYLFKGGAVLMLIQFYGLTSSIKSFFKARESNNRNKLASSSVVIIWFISALINTFWGASAITMLLSMMLFSALTFNRNDELLLFRHRRFIY
ncbi:MAG TPA: hypothetical protein DCS12_10860 [Clostridiales bacterium]|nr:hypothetical protein [Clostridiales bacterium]